MPSQKAILTKAGYRQPTVVKTLTFDGTEYEGAEVMVRSRLSLGLYIKLSDLANSDAGASSVYALFGDKILSAWNLVYDGSDGDHEDGDPIPATGEGILDVQPDLAALILTKWREAIESVPAPLGEASPVGEPTPVG